jgi:hypothetical protein
MTSERSADLVSALAALDVHDLTHFEEAAQGIAQRTSELHSKERIDSGSIRQTKFQKAVNDLNSTQRRGRRNSASFRIQRRQLPHVECLQETSETEPGMQSLARVTH